MSIDFETSWCGPCKFMEWELQAMSEKFADVTFAKIDVDELADVAQEFGVQAMPTFVLLKKGKEVDKVVGAKKDEWEMKIQRRIGSKKMGFKERTPFMIASLFGSKDVLNYILETGRVYVNRACGSDKDTALHSSEENKI